MLIGINVWTSMECPWQDAFTIATKTVIAKMNVSHSSKAALPIVPARLVNKNSNNMTLFWWLKFI